MTATPEGSTAHFAVEPTQWSQYKPSTHERERHPEHPAVGWLRPTGRNGWVFRL